MGRNRSPRRRSRRGILRPKNAVACLVCARPVDTRASGIDTPGATTLWYAVPGGNALLLLLLLLLLLHLSTMLLVLLWCGFDKQRYEEAIRAVTGQRTHHAVSLLLSDAAVS